MIVRSLLLIVFALAGCPTTAVDGLTALSQTKYGLATTQPCIRQVDALRVADAMLPATLLLLNQQGVVKDYIKAAKDAKDARWMVCLVDKPEPCHLGGVWRGPWKEAPGKPADMYGAKDMLAARKRGCSSSYHAWGSVMWPPVCRPEWPDEPHCERSQTDTGWQQGLAHEVFNMAVQRWANVTTPDYSAAVYKHEAAVWARAQELLR